MKAGWEVKTLGEVSDFQGGGQPPKSEFIYEPRDGYIRMLQIRDFKSDERAVYIPLTNRTNSCVESDIMIGRYGASVGQIHRGKAGAYNVALIRTIPNSQIIDRDYFYYYLTSELFQQPLVTVADRSAQAGFSKQDISPFPIPLPPLDEQKQIVAVLDAAFEGLALARANTEANLQSARELFEATLDFEILPNGREWSHSSLGEVCEFVGGSQPPKSEFLSRPATGLVRLIQIRDYKSDAKAVYIPIKLARRFCKPDDIMIGRYGPPIFQILRGIDGAYNVALMKAVPNEEQISKDFLYYFLKNREILRFVIHASSRAAGQDGVNKDALENYPIGLPTVDEQTAIVARLESIQLEAKSLEHHYRAKLADIDQLRQSLLQKAFAGELS